MVIWKFRIELGKVRYELPKYAKVLCVQIQDGEPNMWFICDPKQPLEQRAFSIIGTGHEFNGDLIESYIGTFQLEGGRFVFHVFEVVLI